MLVSFSELKNYALLLSNALRDFNPSIMLWQNDSPTLFQNYDINGFTPSYPMRKPFSVQIILESFSRSCGYKSYNALLADQNRPEILDVNLRDLNPAPRNDYYSALWIRFIDSMCNSIHNGYINGATPSYLTYRNFKPHNFQFLTPFMGWGIEVTLKPNKEIGRQIEYLECYYPIALSMLFTAYEIGLDKVEVNPSSKTNKARSAKARLPSYLNEDNNAYTWVLQNVPLKQFLVHEQWQDPNFSHFKQALSLCMSSLFDTTLVFTDQGDNPLDCLVKIVSPVDIAALARNAVNLFKSHTELRQWAIQEVQRLDDHRYYTSIDYKPVSALNGDFKPKEFVWNVKHQLSLKDNNISECAIYGTKAFWINQCWHTFYHEKNITNGSIKKHENHIQNFLKHKLSLFNENQEIPKYFIDYYFEVKGIKTFIKNCGGLIKERDIPKTIMVKDGFSVVFGEIEMNILKIAIQSQLMAILPRATFDFDMHSKHIGNPNVLQFDPVENQLQTPKLTLKEVQYDSGIGFNTHDADLIFNFDLTQAIHSITIERIPPSLIKKIMYLKSYKHELADNDDEFEYFNCSKLDDFEQFMFTSDIHNQSKYCLLKISMFDTPYKTKLDLDPDCGWNKFNVLCEIKNLDFDNFNKDILFELSLCYSSEDELHKDRLKALTLMVDAMNGDANMKITNLITTCLNESKLQWNEHKAFMEEQGAENSNLNTLYQFLTHYPNTTEQF